MKVSKQYREEVHNAFDRAVSRIKNRSLQRLSNHDRQRIYRYDRDGKLTLRDVIEVIRYFENDLLDTRTNDHYLKQKVKYALELEDCIVYDPKTMSYRLHERYVMWTG